MANPEQFAILQKGTDVWNTWRENIDQAIAIDLRGVDLTYVAPGWTQPGGNVGLSYANLSFANLSQANVYGADLTSANLSHANLGSADLNGANLKDANLSFSNLKGANLSMTLLTGADFTDADLGYTLFAFCDLRDVRGLESVHHSGPSSIGIETIYASNGEIPEVFLRGAGVPDEFITYAKSLVGSAIEFYSCFISYSTSDQEFADRLHADLQAKGVRCWFAPHDIQGGRKLHEQIDEAIRIHDKLLLILSQSSMNSNWVKT